MVASVPRVELPRSALERPRADFFQRNASEMLEGTTGLQARWNFARCPMGGATEWREFMSASTQLVPRPNRRTPKRLRKSTQQFDIHSLVLEIQTLSLMLNDLRSRLCHLEKKVNHDKITETDRAALRKLDRVFEKPSPSNLLLLTSQCSPPSEMAVSELQGLTVARVASAPS